MSFSSFLPPHHILQYPLLEEWIFDFVLLGANDITYLSVLLKFSHKRS